MILPKSQMCLGKGLEGGKSIICWPGTKRLLENLKEAKNQPNTGPEQMHDPMSRTSQNLICEMDTQGNCGLHRTAEYGHESGFTGISYTRMMGTGVGVLGGIGKQTADSGQ